MGSTVQMAGREIIPVGGGGGSSALRRSDDHRGQYNTAIGGETDNAITHILKK